MTSFPEKGTGVGDAPLSLETSRSPGLDVSSERGASPSHQLLCTNTYKANEPIIDLIASITCMVNDVDKRTVDSIFHLADRL